jgi:hypothetical protein
MCSQKGTSTSQKQEISNGTICKPGKSETTGQYAKEVSRARDNGPGTKRKRIDWRTNFDIRAKENDIAEALKPERSEAHDPGPRASITGVRALEYLEQPSARDGVFLKRRPGQQMAAGHVSEKCDASNKL